MDRVKHRGRYERKCKFSMNEVVVKSNNSLAVLGALADRLQCCTVSKKIGHKGYPKWKAGSEKEVLGAKNNF